MSRKSISPEVQAKILHSNRRRCPICFSYEFDTSMKRGQIAHIDKDHTNNSPENLTFLCLKHHDEYDSKTSQSKGITQKELIKCIAELKEYLSKTFPGQAVSDSKKEELKIKKILEKYINNTNETLLISPEVYKLRLPVYYAFRNFLWIIIRDARFEMHDLFEYLDGTHEAPFLYDDIMNEFLELVKEKAIDFRKAQRQLELRYDLNEDERSRLIDEETELLVWLTESYDIGLKLFSKYLKI